MRSRLLVSVFAFTLTGVIASCSDEITAIDQSFEESATWVATLSGANERPNPVTTPATGRAFFVDNGNSITFYIDYSGLTSNGTIAHIHVAPADQAGGILIDLPTSPSNLPDATSGVLAGTIDMTLANVASPNRTPATTPQQLRDLFNSGGSYVNIHTSTNGGGEIRGQVVPR
jgi:CHRD domain